MLNRPGALGSVIVITAFVFLMVITIIRYWDRKVGPSGFELHPNSSTARAEVAWSELPKLQPFDLVERTGEPVSEAKMEGRVSLVSFFFSRCPSICKRQNEALQRLQAKFRDAGQDVLLVSVTVDPAYDTPKVLEAYAKSYNADAEDWLFLTGDFEEIELLGYESFQLPIGPETHSTSLMLVDRWGRVRDRFDWEQSSELKKLVEEVGSCLEEVVPPKDLIVETRMPSFAIDESHAETLSSTPEDNAWQEKDWIDEFTLINAENRPVSSKDLEGKVWVANSFFTRCPTICKEMMAQVKTLQDSLDNQPVVFISLTSDPGYDTPSRLMNYGESIGYDPDGWQLLTGDPLYVRRVMSEFLGMFVDTTGPTHDENLFLVDKWGRVRGKFAFNQTDDLVKLRMEIDRLVAETERSDADLPVGNSGEETNTGAPDGGAVDEVDEKVESPTGVESPSLP